MKYIVNGFLFGLGAYAGMVAMREIEDKLIPDLLGTEWYNNIENYGKYEADKDK